MLQIKSFEFNPFQENTYILYDETKECVIIDPGCFDKQEQQSLVNFITANQLTVTKLINTHCHIDHVLGNAFVKQHFKVKLFIHPAEEALLRAVKTYALIMDFTTFRIQPQMNLLMKIMWLYLAINR